MVTSDDSGSSNEAPESESQVAFGAATFSLRPAPRHLVRLIQTAPRENIRVCVPTTNSANSRGCVRSRVSATEKFCRSRGTVPGDMSEKCELTASEDARAADVEGHRGRVSRTDETNGATAGDGPTAEDDSEA